MVKDMMGKQKFCDVMGCLKKSVRESWEKSLLNRSNEIED